MSKRERQKLLDSQIIENGSTLHTQNGLRTISGQSSLTWVQKTAFGFGHIYNDLCAAMWFSYTLLFLQVVLHMESTAAGSMLLLGQVMDALATPVVGVLADRWGSKRLWHFAGTSLVLCSFPMIFSRCLGCWMSSTGTYLRWWQPFYYGTVIVIFQCGWAIVQISHLAMIPALTENLNERSELTAIRYTASVCSGVTVYLITWGVLKIDNNNNILGPADDYKFRDIALFITAIGSVLTIIFHLGLQHQKNIDKRNSIQQNESSQTNSIQQNESAQTNSDVSISPSSSQNNFITDTKSNLQRSKDNSKVLVLGNTKVKKNFFISPLLYQSALLYVASRLFSALSLVYMPLFLDERLNMVNTSETVESIASVPLASYISSFFASLLLKYRTNLISNQLLYSTGSLISIGGCIWVAIFLDPTSGPYQLYTVAALLGAGSSITMVSSLCITADLIGPHSDQGAVVYSIVTFADKLITGIAVIIIENYKCENQEDCPEYYREILAYICGGSALLGFITISISQLLSIKCCHKKTYIQIS